MPHIMKRNSLLYLSLALLTLAFASCNTRTMFTPGLQTATQLIRTSAAGVKDTITMTDTLNVGDTVRMGMICNGYYDYLRTVVVSGDTSKVLTSLAWVDSLNYVLDEDADPAHGRLSFLPEKAYAIYTTMTYIPVATGVHKIDIKITSSAPDKYNQYSGYFMIAVK